MRERKKNYKKNYRLRKYGKIAEHTHCTVYTHYEYGFVTQIINRRITTFQNPPIAKFLILVLELLEIS